MHVLITSDTVGGVWTYTEELITGLVEAGHQVTLVSFGPLPTRHQTVWLEALPTVDYRPTDYRLEWMEVCERDIAESRRYLEQVIDEVHPDLLHFSQYCYGDLAVAIPRIVVAHSDVVSWWVAVHGCEPEDTPWVRQYRERVTRGLEASDLVVAPSAWMLDQLGQYYRQPSSAVVVPNGRTPEFFDRHSEKQDLVVTVGRLWDPAKQTRLVVERESDARVVIVGWEEEPGRRASGFSLGASGAVELAGPKSQAELRALYAQAAIYAAPSRYEPFGLAPLEAALSGCCLVMNDNPVFHELWDDACLFFRKDDPKDLSRAIAELRASQDLRREYSDRAFRRAFQRFTRSRMVAHYQELYQDISAASRVA